MSKRSVEDEFVEVYKTLDPEGQKSIFQLVYYHNLSEEEKMELQSFLDKREVPKELVVGFME